MISSGWMQEMEPIPEEGTEADGSEWGATSDGGTGKRTMRKKEVYTSEQINTLVSFQISKLKVSPTMRFKFLKFKDHVITHNSGSSEFSELETFVTII
ncbi:hypothetical protein GCK72_012575 [Caenorhabditis remanei]|uniref:Uncharacterized protein n=1 Tax=Caenorhabditis remanei TaxID=31234 RepID=A0A6A5GNY4_CAERE|nr:hypothetical protein GCK72_012575 [Caenorhabditis remanei]KAF1756122.1 hypothetical protein GCK72_012575 [Caenorhabditis remanei]